MDARERALAALVDLLTPAAALGVECPTCRALSAVRCTWFVRETPNPTQPMLHQARYEEASEQLRLHLRTLLDI